MTVVTSIPYNFGDIVYLKTDIDQKPRMVIGVKHCADGGILIEVITGTLTSYHYPIEVTTDKNPSL